MEQQGATDDVHKLREGGFKGELIQPGDGAYDKARAVYNGMIDKLRMPQVPSRGVGWMWSLTGCVGIASA
jgi:hypothetical protein